MKKNPLAVAVEKGLKEVAQALREVAKAVAKNGKTKNGNAAARKAFIGAMGSGAQQVPK